METNCECHTATPFWIAFGVCLPFPEAGTLRPTWQEMRCGHLTLEAGAASWRQVQQGLRPRSFLALWHSWSEATKACWQGGKETNEDRFVLNIESWLHSKTFLTIADGHVQEDTRFPLENVECGYVCKLIQLKTNGC